MQLRVQRPGGAVPLSTARQIDAGALRSMVQPLMIQRCGSHACNCTPEERAARVGHNFAQIKVFPDPGAPRQAAAGYSLEVSDPSDAAEVQAATIAQRLFPNGSDSAVDRLSAR